MLKTERLLRLCLAFVGLGLALPAAARVYPVPIDADTEDELRLLYEEGLLEADDYETLLELLNNPLDLNRARRGDLYDLPGLTWKGVDAVLQARKQRAGLKRLDDLRGVEGIDEDALEQLRPFVTIRPIVKAPAEPVRGRVRMRAQQVFEPVEPLADDANANSTLTVEQLGLDRGPEAYVAAEVEAWKWLEAGALVLTHSDVDGVVYDPQRRDFHISYGPVVELGRVYAAAHRLAFDAVLGSYSAGFGLGLAFDTTSRSRPDGPYPDLTISTTDDFGLSDRLFGAAIKGQGLVVGNATLEGTLFLSAALQDVYQYDIGLTGGEALDPQEVELDSPRVYLDGQRVGYVTLPNAVREDLVGANATARFGDRNSLGLTTWTGRQVRTILDGVDDPYAFVTRDGYPVADVVGAVGLHGTFGLGPVDVGLEGAKSFSGGFGMLGIANLSLERGELELSLRRYATDFDNPHARGVAAADEYGGMRDRDEQGARLKAQVVPKKGLELRATGDLWQTLSTGYWNADLYGRVSYKPVRELQLVVFGQHKNQNLAVNDRSRVYGGEVELEDEDSDELYVDEQTVETDPIDRSGSRNTVGLEARTRHVKNTILSAHYKRYYEDAGLVYPNDGGLCIPWYQIGYYTWFKVQVDPVESTQVSARVRYRDDDIYGSLDDHQLETYLQITAKLPKRVKLSARGTLGWDLADPAAPWDAACDAAEQPTLDGTCVVDVSTLETNVEESQKYGAAWIGAEVRF